jgi:nitroreductase
MFRHATTIFDDKKIIPDDIINDILISGQLSPSSFGLEPWRFIVIQNKEKQKEMEPMCYNQLQISTASHIVILVGRVDFNENDSYIDECVDRYNKNKEKIRKTIRAFFTYTKDIKNWASHQCYIAGADMMITGAIKKVDSCPMAGFIPDKVSKFLKLKESEFPALIIPFGYRTKEPRDKIRWDLDKIVEFIK